MKIVCPSCAATYEVPEAALSAKRAVRCARCGNSWVPETAHEPAADSPPPPANISSAQAAPAADAPHVAAPHAVEAISAAAPHPELSATPQAPASPTAAATAIDDSQSDLSPETPAPPVDPPPAQAVRQAPVLAWAVSVAAIIILGLSGIVFRGAIMTAWPPSERAYAAIGLYHR